MFFHIYKSSRGYDNRGYCGPSSNGELCEFVSLEEARIFREDVLIRNNLGVGWIIIDTRTGEEF